MPIPKRLEDLVQDLKTALSGDDNNAVQQILDGLLQEQDLPMEFMVGVAGPTIKSLRSHADSVIRKHASTLTRIWKESVAAKLAKSKRAGGDGDGGEGSAAQSSVVDSSLASSLSVPRSGAIKVLPERVRVLNDINTPLVAGKPVIYWMSRDQRVQDNWALLYAQEQALKVKAPLAVCFNLVDSFLGAGIRHFGFMLRGLQEVQSELAAHNIPMFLLRGNHEVTFPNFVREHDAGLVVCDYGPLRIGRTWRNDVGEALVELGVALHEVDAHNIVPVWLASDKQEVGARTLRPKIHRHLSKFLQPFPAVSSHPHAWRGECKEIDFVAVLQSLSLDTSVPEVDWATPGSAAGMANLARFLGERLGKFNAERNNPNFDAASDMSPWLHYGQVA